MKQVQTLDQVLKRQDPARPVLIKSRDPQKTKPFIREDYHGPVESAYTVLNGLEGEKGQSIVKGLHVVIVQTSDRTTHYPALWIVC